jgi:hypothetical protein
LVRELDPARRPGEPLHFLKREAPLPDREDLERPIDLERRAPDLGRIDDSLLR